MEKNNLQVHISNILNLLDKNKLTVDNKNQNQLTTECVNTVHTYTQKNNNQVGLTEVSLEAYAEIMSKLKQFFQATNAAELMTISIILS